MGGGGVRRYNAQKAVSPMDQFGKGTFAEPGWVVTYVQASGVGNGQ